MTERVVGTVREVLRYPVKSMAAERLNAVPVSWHGMAGDRRWAFIRAESERSSFPWLTIREKPELWRYQARFEDPSDVESSKVLVRTPDGAEIDVADPELARSFGDGVRVIKQYSGVFDTFPISVLSVQSVQGLSGRVGEKLTTLRFRPSIVVDVSEPGEFPEDSWVGSVVRIGSLRCRMDVRDKRCVMVNVDPTGGAPSNPNVLRVIANERNARFGVYGTTVEPGQVAVGDPVSLEG